MLVLFWLFGSFFTLLAVIFTFAAGFLMLFGSILALLAAIFAPAPVLRVFFMSLLPEWTFTCDGPPDQRWLALALV